MGTRRLRPVTPELQARAAALDARCDIDLTRCTQFRVSGAAATAWSRIPGGAGNEPARRACCVRITLRHGRRGLMSDLVDASASTCAEALELAITEAEARGWHLPHVAAP